MADIFCLADPDQRIFDYRVDINPHRIDGLRAALTPQEFDLGGENHRSPHAGILKFANAVLHNEAPLTETPDVARVRYWPRTFASTIHACVVWTFSELWKAGVQDPSVAVLSRSNSLVSDISAILAETHDYTGDNYPSSSIMLFGMQSYSQLPMLSWLQSSSGRRPRLLNRLRGP